VRTNLVCPWGRTFIFQDRECTIRSTVCTVDMWAFRECQRESRIWSPKRRAGPNCGRQIVKIRVSRISQGLRSHNREMDFLLMEAAIGD
jgi:hypothetical protein